VTYGIGCEGVETQGFVCLGVVLELADCYDRIIVRTSVRIVVGVIVF